MEAPLENHEAADQGARPATPSSTQGDDDQFGCHIPAFQLEALGQSDSANSRHGDFLASLRRDAIILYQVYLDKVSLRVTGWTYYDGLDKVKPTALHHDWPKEPRELGPIRLPAGAEGSCYQQRAKPKAPDVPGRTLRPKLIDLKSQMSWGNPGEQVAIHRHISQTDAAIGRDLDWVAPLKRCCEGPAEGYLHTFLPSGEVIHGSS